MEKKILSLLCVLAAIANNAHANGFYWSIQDGPSWPVFHDSGSIKNIAVDSYTTNQYTMATPAQNKPLFGAGINYQWDYRYASLSLGLSADHTSAVVSGINSPFINGGHFDTLTYSARDTSYAVMFEPKLIWTAYSLQPYLITGAGIAFNHMNNYTEEPTDPNGTAVATPTPFNSATSRNFAYELGVGFQHVLPLHLTKKDPTVAIDYRWMNWGPATLSAANGQPNNDGLSFGRLRTTSLNVSLIFPLC